MTGPRLTGTSGGAPLAAPPSGQPSIETTAIDSLQDVLRTEHAAVWSYALLIAFVPAAQAAGARKDVEAHRTLRDKIVQTLTQLGARPISAEPAYALPEPVTDALSAGRLAVTAEADVLAGWRSVLEHTENTPLRNAAFTALIECTARATRWRSLTQTSPVVPVLPGIIR